MKTLHTTDPTQYPPFWNEEWLRRAIDELDTRKITPEERAYFAHVTAANAETVNAAKQRIVAVKIDTVREVLAMSLTVAQAARLANITEDFVLDVQRNIAQDN